ncbi:MAG: carbamate kinase, partial [Thermoanaerobaculia bacterium]|nr:carbamate kinase [Thermoanaerobaculia bacterium]
TSLLARELGADLLLLLTDVDGVYRDWGRPGATRIPTASVPELRSLHLEEGSMAPKVEAACRFVEATGGRAVIGALGDAAGLARGEGGTGTVVTS